MLIFRAIKCFLLFSLIRLRVSLAVMHVLINLFHWAKRTTVHGYVEKFYIGIVYHFKYVCMYKLFYTLCLVDQNKRAFYIFFVNQYNDNMESLCVYDLIAHQGGDATHGNSTPCRLSYEQEWDSVLWGKNLKIQVKWYENSKKNWQIFVHFIISHVCA